MFISKEQKACVGLAWVHARDRLRLPNAEAYQWALAHWHEFMVDLGTPTGRMLLAAEGEMKPIG